jgi:SAM-dependent methyltransferase
VTFDDIYRTNAWNGIETRSGPGSHVEPTRRVGGAIVDLVRLLGVRSVIDVGCGEANWQPDLPGYVGVDVSPLAIDAARRRHPDRAFRVGTIDDVGAFDMAIVRDVVQHLSIDHGIRLLGGVRATWLLASTYVDGVNVDVADGDAYRPNLEAPPFGLDPALLLIHDGYAYHDGDALRDPGKMLGLWRAS